MDFLEDWPKLEVGDLFSEARTRAEAIHEMCHTHLHQRLLLEDIRQSLRGRKHALAGEVEGKNQTQRDANLSLALDMDEPYQTLYRQERTLYKEVEALSIDIEYNTQLHKAAVAALRAMGGR